MMAVTPAMIDFVLALILAEFVLIGLILRRAGLTGLIAPLGFFLASGALLFVCLKIALQPSGAFPPAALSAGIGASFVTHLAAVLTTARALSAWRKG